MGRPTRATPPTHNQPQHVAPFLSFTTNLNQRATLAGKTVPSLDRSPEQPSRHTGIRRAHTNLCMYTHTERPNFCTYYTYPVHASLSMHACQMQVVQSRHCTKRRALLPHIKTNSLLIHTRHRVDHPTNHTTC